MSHTSIIASKSHLIIKSPEHVHQTPLTPNKCSKTLCNLTSLGLERVSRCPIGLIPLKSGVFPRWILVQVMQVYEVVGYTFGHGVHVITGKCRILPVDAFVEGELHLVMDAIIS
jgi:hypothetical protein